MLDRSKLIAGKEEAVAQWRDLFQYRVVAGEPLAAGDARLVPICHVLTLRWPGGQWIWNRPAAVSLERAGTTSRFPVVDVTRLLQWALLGAAATFALIGLFSRGRRSDE